MSRHMFERYTEKARRVIFFARYEAGQYGNPYIEAEHLLLGLMREDKGLANRFLRTQGSIESIRKEIESRKAAACTAFTRSRPLPGATTPGHSANFCCNRNCVALLKVPLTVNRLVLLNKK